MHGQTRIEFIFGIVVFSIIIFYIVNQINIIFSSNISDYETSNLKAETNSLMEILTNDKGYPNNWNDFLGQGWLKRREIQITLSSKELFNQQVRINVTYDSDMKVDFGDLRFADSNKVSGLPYWIEKKVDGSYAVVWVRIPKIPASGKKSIYMYYGYPTAQSEGNGNNVFIQFLDLSGNFLPSGWTRTDIGKSGTATVSNGILTITNTGGANVYGSTYEATHVYKNLTISGDFVAVANVTGQKNTHEWAKAGITVQNYVKARNYNGMAMMITTPAWNGCALFWMDESYIDIAPADYEADSGYVTFPTYIKLVRNNTYVSGWNSTNGKDWNQVGYAVVPYGIEDFQYVTLFVTPRVTGATGEINFSMFYVYQYASPEPTGIIKSEETRTNESWYPVRTIGLVEDKSILSKNKIRVLNENCDLLKNFGLNNYRLKVYNSTNLILFCGTDTLRPAKIVVNKYVLIENDVGNVTLEMW